MKFTASLGTPASKRMSMNFAAMVGESAAGLTTTVLPVTSEATTMPAMMAQGKFHGGTTTPTQRNVDEIVAFAAHGRELLRVGKAQHFAAVEFAEVHGFGDVRVGFDPSFSNFVADES